MSVRIHLHINAAGKASKTKDSYMHLAYFVCEQEEKEEEGERTHFTLPSIHCSRLNVSVSVCVCVCVSTNDPSFFFTASINHCTRVHLLSPCCLPLPLRFSCSHATVESFVELFTASLFTFTYSLSACRLSTFLLAVCVSLASQQQDSL